MATPAQEEMVNRMVRIHMEVMGADISARQLQVYSDAVELSITGSNSFEKATDKVRKALQLEGKTIAQANDLMKKWSTSVGAASKNTTVLSKSLEGLHSMFTGLLGPVTSFGALLGAQSLAIGSVIADVGRLNTSLISGSGSWAKYGVGTANFEKNMKQIASATHLTQAETMQLLSSYERGFNHVSMGNAVQVMKNLKAAVGANKEAMSSMLGVISNVVEKFPDLETSITRLNNSDRQRLSLQNQLMVLNGTMGLGQAKQFQDYIQGNRQQEQADQKRQKQVEDQIEALQDMKRAFEEIARSINDTLMPSIEKMVKYFVSAKDQIMKWVPAIAIAVGGFVALRAVITSVGIVLRGIQLASTVGGLAGGAGRLAGGLRTTLGGLGSVGGVGAGLLAAGGGLAGAAGVSSLVDYGVEKVFGEKREQQGAGTRVVKAGATMLGGVGAGALTGAAIGALGGPIGAAAGALIGAIAGIGYALWDWHKQTIEIAKYQEALAPELKKHQDDLIAEFGGVSKAAHDFHDALRENVANRISAISNADEERSDYRANQLGLGKSDDEISESSDGKALDAKLEKARQDGINAIEEAYRSSAAAGDDLAQQYYALLKKRIDLEIQVAQMEDDRRKGKDVDQRSIDQAKTQIAQINDVGELGDDGKPKQGGGLKYLSGQMDQAGKEAQANTALRMKREADAARRSELAESNAVKARYAMDLGDSTAFDQIRDNVGQQQSDLQTRVATTDGLPLNEKQDNKVTSALDPKDIALLQQQGVKGSQMEAGGAISLSDQSQKDLENAQQRVKTLLDAAQAQKANSSSLAEQNAIEVQITALKRTQKALSHDLAEVDQGRKGVQSDIDAMNGNILALMNEQRIRLDSINKLYQAQLGVTASLATQMSSIGHIDLGNLDTQVGDSVNALRKRNDELARTISMTDENLRGQRKVSVQDPDNRQKLTEAMGGPAKLDMFVEGKLDKASLDKAIAELKRKAIAAVDPADSKKYVELAGMLDDAAANNAEQQSKRLELQRNINEAAKQEQEIRMSVIAAFQSQLDYQEKMITSASQQVELADSLGAGLKASVQMRMQEAQAVQNEIEQEKALLAELGKQAKAYEDAHPGEQAMDIRNKMLDVENKITSQHLKQAQILKTLRDGYVSAMTAMTAGTGMFSKILITQDKNLGFGLKQLNVLQSKSSGGIGGGSATPAGQFTQDGMTFGNQGPGYRLDTPGGGTSNWNPANGFSREAAENEIARRNAAARAAAGSASTMGANPNVSGAVLGDAAGRRDGGFAGYFADGGMPLGHMGLSRHKDGVTGLIKGESERGDQYQIGVAGGEVIMNQRQWPRVASALGMSQAEFAGMVTAKDYTKLPTDRFADGGVVGGVSGSSEVQAAQNDLDLTRSDIERQNNVVLKSIDNKLTNTNQLLSRGGSPNGPTSTVVSPNVNNAPIVVANGQTSRSTQMASEVARGVPPAKTDNQVAATQPTTPNQAAAATQPAGAQLPPADHPPTAPTTQPVKPTVQTKAQQELADLMKQREAAAAHEEANRKYIQAQMRAAQAQAEHTGDVATLDEMHTNHGRDLLGGFGLFGTSALEDQQNERRKQSLAKVNETNATVATLQGQIPKYDGPSTHELDSQIAAKQKEVDPVGSAQAAARKQVEDDKKKLAELQAQRQAIVDAQKHKDELQASLKAADSDVAGHSQEVENTNDILHMREKQNTGVGSWASWGTAGLINGVIGLGRSDEDLMDDQMSGRSGPISDGNDMPAYRAAQAKAKEVNGAQYERIGNRDDLAAQLKALKPTGSVDIVDQQIADTQRNLDIRMGPTQAKAAREGKPLTPDQVAQLKDVPTSEQADQQIAAANAARQKAQSKAAIIPPAPKPPTIDEQIGRTQKELADEQGYSQRNQQKIDSSQSTVKDLDTYLQSRQVDSSGMGPEFKAEMSRRHDAFVDKFKAQGSYDPKANFEDNANTYKMYQASSVSQAQEVQGNSTQKVTALQKQLEQLQAQKKTEDSAKSTFKGILGSGFSGVGNLVGRGTKALGISDAQIQTHVAGQSALQTGFGAVSNLVGNVAHMAGISDTAIAGHVQSRNAVQSVIQSGMGGIAGLFGHIPGMAEVSDKTISERFGPNATPLATAGAMPAIATTPQATAATPQATAGVMPPATKAMPGARPVASTNNTATVPPAITGAMPPATTATTGTKTITTPEATQATGSVVPATKASSGALPMAPATTATLPQAIASSMPPSDAGVMPFHVDHSPLHYLTHDPDPEHHRQHRSHVHQQMNGGFNNHTHVYGQHNNVYPNANVHQVHHEQHLPMAMKHATNSVIDTSLMTPAQKAAYQSTVATRSAGDKIADKVMADSIARHKADTASSPEMLASIARNKGLASSIPIKSKGTPAISPLLPKPITSPVASAKKPPDAVPAAGKPVVTAAQPQVQADPNATSGQVPAAGPSRPVLPPSQPANAVTTTATNAASDAAQGGGGAGMPITFNGGGIKVDYGDLNKFGAIVKQQIDASFSQWAKSMGSNRTTPNT